ncbi:MAG: hypothetical protein GY936_16060 [Ignavibacteriae bacterium]|nr:hypothetical protein [Ignavibacteriota bacterium]
MKKLTFFIFLFLSIHVSFGQSGNRTQRNSGQKYRQLEKIKLLEVLDLDEEVAIKFFIRKDKHHETQRVIMEKHKTTLNKLETVLNDENKKESELAELIQQNEQLEIDLCKGKNKFINSVKDILNTEQIGKLILFEYKFKRDIRDMLIKGGKNRYLNRRGERKNID